MKLAGFHPRKNVDMQRYQKNLSLNNPSHLNLIWLETTRQLILHEYPNAQIYLTGSQAEDIINNYFHMTPMPTYPYKDVDLLIFDNDKFVRTKCSDLIRETPCRLDNLGTRLVKQHNGVMYFLMNTSIAEKIININNGEVYYTDVYKKSVEEKMIYPPFWYSVYGVDILNENVDNIFSPIICAQKNKLKWSDEFVGCYNDVACHSISLYTENMKLYYAKANCTCSLYNKSIKDLNLSIKFLKKYKISSKIIDYIYDLLALRSDLNCGNGDDYTKGIIEHYKKIVADRWLWKNSQEQ
jgi:hypothetical protein